MPASLTSSSSQSLGARPTVSFPAKAAATHHHHPPVSTPNAAKSAEKNNDAYISFKVFVGGIAFFFSGCVLGVILAVSLVNFELTRESLLSDAVMTAADLSAAKIERFLNVSFTNVVSSGTAARMLSNTLHGGGSAVATQGPWRKNGSGVWSVEPVAQRAFKRQMTYLMERQLLHPFNGQRELVVTRWRDGAASIRAVDFATRSASTSLYRSRLGDGFWTGVNVLDLPSVNITSGWNVRTGEKQDGEFLITATRTTVHGEFWNNSLAIARGERNSRSPGQDPIYSKLPTWVESMALIVPHMTFQNADNPARRSPFIMTFTGLSMSYFGSFLRENLIVDAEDPELSSRSRSYLVARRLGVVLSQSSPELTFVSRNYTPGRTRLDTHCYPFPAASVMGCFKNVSDAPDFALLRALLGSLPAAALATKSGIPTPMLSNPDIPGEIVRSTVHGSDGHEYFVVAETLRLDPGMDLFLTLITFTPRNLFSRNALEARNAAITVAVVVFVIIIIVLQLLLFMIGTAVSDLAEEMANPLQSHILLGPQAAVQQDRSRESPTHELQRTVKTEQQPSTNNNSQATPRAVIIEPHSDCNHNSDSGNKSDVSSNKSWPSLIVRNLTGSLEELVTVREEFNFCIEKIKQLRGFVDTNARRYLANGSVAANSSEFTEALLVNGAGNLNRSSSIKVLIHEDSSNSSNALASSIAASAPPAQRRVKFRPDTVVVAANDTESPDSNTLVGEHVALRRVPRPRRQVHQRFCCLALSFPFISKLALRVRQQSDFFPAYYHNNNNNNSRSNTANRDSVDAALHRLLFDAVAATAKAAHDIVSKAHATSIDELSTVGDELMCCLRMRSTFSRSRFVINTLQQSVTAAYALKQALWKPAGNRKKSAAPPQRVASEAIAAAVASLSCRDQFVAVGVASTLAICLTRNISTSTDLVGDDSDGEGSARRQRPVTIVGGAVPQSHAVLRCMQRAAGALIYDRDDCNLLLHDSPSVCCTTNNRVIYSVPFSIGIARELMALVEPDFVAVEAVYSPEMQRRDLELRCAQQPEQHEQHELVPGNDDADVASANSATQENHDRTVFCRMQHDNRRFEIQRIAPAEVESEAVSW